MDNKTLMQYFEWYLPDDGLLWKRCQIQAKELKKSGIDMVWLPPAYKGAAGCHSVGYDVYDTYDLGEFTQKGSLKTKYGTKDEYINAVKAFQENGIEVLADTVLNHMMGADATEHVSVQEVAASNREQVMNEGLEIQAWSKFSFPERNGKYSAFQWNASHFSGTDWDEGARRNGIFRFKGKNWNRQTDQEHGNYDYLMGVDLDTDNPETVKAVTDWGKWYADTVSMDGFRLDAVKHISADFYKNWLHNIRTHTGKNMFAVGEYWSPDLGRLLQYLDLTGNTMSLFDVPLHFAFYKAATSNGQMDMGQLFVGTLVKERPQNTVTFVDNHDTQPGQALCSYIPGWFKQTAYACILLRKDGLPCVFYGDYYGIPHDKIPPVLHLKRILMVRKKYAYGEQLDYFDDASLVGFTRQGDKEHNHSGLAVLFTDTVAGAKRMYVGKQFAGQVFFDVLGNTDGAVKIDAEGYGEFRVNNGSVSVWVKEQAYNEVCVNC